MPRTARSPRRLKTVEDVKFGQTADFSDPESQRVLAAAARALARELGRQAAREYFAELIKARRFPP
jgi:hypothetical protein